MAVQQVFKKYEIVTATTADQMSLNVTAMLSIGNGWQLASPMMCVSRPDGGLHYYVGMMQFEFITMPEPEVPAPSSDTPQ